MRKWKSDPQEVGNAQLWGHPPTVLNPRPGPLAGGVAPWQTGGGGVARGHGVGLFAFGGAYWPLATVHSDPLWSERVLVVSTEPLDDLSYLTTPGSAIPETGCCPCR